MYESSVQSVLRCEQCNKPFDKPSTLKRHGYYCRSRKAGTATRPRSCVCCARGKARCDNKQPECSRCKAKAFECHYPGTIAEATSPRTQPGDDVMTERRKTAPSLVVGSPGAENREEASNGNGEKVYTAHDTSGSEFANLEGDYLGWDYADTDLAGFLNLQTYDESVQYPSWESSSIVRQSTPSAEQIFQLQQAISPPSASIPVLPAFSPRSLLQRPKIETGTQNVANLIIHTLKSYPLMMLRRNTPPPFIHPHLISPAVKNDYMEPLNNSISLVHMINSGIRGSQKLFWKNVHQECERLVEIHLKLNKWELLAAMQALSIYIIIRLDQGETDHNNFDFILIATVTVIAKRFNDIKHNAQALTNNFGLESSWKDWIFEESGRRLCVVYQVVNMLVYFEPAAMCDRPTDLLIAPLPAKKHLWEAIDEFVWKAESERETEIQAAFGLAANGELIKMDEGNLYCSDSMGHHKAVASRAASRSTASWANWFSGMDSFGGLVMLAASLGV